MAPVAILLRPVLRQRGGRFAAASDEMLNPGGVCLATHANREALDRFEVHRLSDRLLTEESFRDDGGAKRKDGNEDVFVRAISDNCSKEAGGAVIFKDPTDYRI